MFKGVKIKKQFLGGVKDKQYKHDGSGGILIFFRWFLLQKLKESGLIHKYERFIITRSDYIYQLPHPKLDILDKSSIWIPNAEYYGGFTDRHVVLSKEHVEPYLNIFHNMVLQSNTYFMKMKSFHKWNLERLIKFHLTQNNVIQKVKLMPYVMYTVRNINGTSRWCKGKFSKELGYYIKYNTEYIKSNKYKQEFEKSGKSIHEFYTNIIHP